MKTALLRGREHHRIGSVALEGLGRTAIALSRGGAKKTYDHTDPNEDCAALALDAGGELLIAADGHHGDHGSEAAVETILAEFAPRLLARDAPTREREAWPELAYEILLRANRAILDAATQTGVAAAPTTLVFALVRPAEDLLLHASVGDSHLFAIDAHAAVDLGGSDPAWKFTPFLGYEQANRELLGRYARVGLRSLSTLRAIALVTDGLSHPGIGVPDPADAVRESVAQIEAGTAADLSAVRACRGILERAMHAQRRQRAGDNLACSVAWLGR